MSSGPVYVPHPGEIGGHPVEELEGADGNPVLITVCSGCGRMRSILFLSKDRWLCTGCRAEGTSPPNLFPIG